MRIVIIAAAVMAALGAAGAGAWYYMGTAPPPDIALPVPSGYCLLTPQNHSVEIAIENQKWLNRHTNHVLAMFANCSQLGRFVRDEGMFLETHGTYLAEMDRPDGAFAGSREAYIANLEDELRAQDPDAAVADHVAKRIDAFFWGIEIKHTRSLGVIAADDVAVYVGLVQAVLRSRDKTTIQVVSVTGMTVLDGAAVSLTLTASDKYGGTVDDLLAAQIVNMHDLVAANGG